MIISLQFKIDGIFFCQNSNEVKKNVHDTTLSYANISCAKKMLQSADQELNYIKVKFSLNLKNVSDTSLVIWVPGTLGNGCYIRDLTVCFDHFEILSEK